MSERAHSVECMWLYVYDCDCDCDCLVFLFLQISKHCTTIETMRHSRWHSLSSLPWIKMAITWKYACMHVVCLLTYYAIWSCNLTAIIVKLQNNELNCLYFFTYHSQCTITVPIYIQHCVILLSSLVALHHARCAICHSSEKKKRSGKTKRKKPQEI